MQSAVGPGGSRPRGRPGGRRSVAEGDRLHAGEPRPCAGTRPPIARSRGLRPPGARIVSRGSRLADTKGFRTDVAREIKDLGVPIVRYPGGNFVSGYNWLDGVGPKTQRPVVLDRAWNSIETNQFGTNEFIDWCGVVGAEPLLGMNFGTGTVESALAYVEYCNLERGTKWSELRRSHGSGARTGLRDTDRPRPQGGQHVRGSSPRDATAPRLAGRRESHDVHAAAALVHGRAPGDSGIAGARSVLEQQRFPGRPSPRRPAAAA